VVELGAGVAGWQPGQRVACAGAKVANHAEFNVVPLRLCAPIPEGLADEEAAFVTVGAIALQGIRTAGVALGESVAVIGLGLIGQLAAQLLRAAGCRVIGIDVEQAKVDLALACGAHRAVLRSEGVDEAVAELTQGRGVDAVVICAAADSNDPVELAGKIARDRGRIVAIGAVRMDLPRRPYYDKELSFFQSRAYGPGRYDPAYEEQGHDYPIGYVRWTEERNFGAFLALCASRQVDVRPLISHRFPIAAAEDAYRLLTGERQAPYLGIVLTYPPGEERQQTIQLAPHPSKATETRVSGEVRIGVVGAGAFASSVLLPALAANRQVALKTLVSAKGVSARQLGQRFGFAAASTDFAALCADPAIDAVVIATRHQLHASQIIAALEAGKHVFAEKPLALTLAELERVRRAAEGSGRLLLVDFNRRFSPLAGKLQAFFAGRGGKPLVMLQRVNAGPVPDESWLHDPAIGGGRILGEVCHFVDLFAFLCGSSPVRVEAQAVRGNAHHDELVATLGFGDGSVGTIVYSSGGDASFPKERLEVFGSGRVAVLDDYRTLMLSKGGKQKTARSPFKDKGHAGAIEAFVKALREGGPPPIALAALCETTRATLAIQEAVGSS
jgi:predicted dehydrogenase